MYTKDVVTVSIGKLVHILVIQKRKKAKIFRFKSKVTSPKKET